MQFTMQMGLINETFHYYFRQVLLEVLLSGIVSGADKKYTSSEFPCSFRDQ